MRKLVFLIIGMALTACATPASVNLQASKIEDLQRTVDKLSQDVEGLSGKIEKAAESAQKAVEKAESAQKLLQKSIVK